LIFKHEIPSGSRLYFGKSANIKREIETIASRILLESNFQEILSPNFSFAEHQGVDDDRELIKLNNEKNHLITLRADSTLDVVRIIEQRLGRSVEHKKWFYIQPIFKYPSDEFYQIGAEWIENSNVEDVIKLAITILSAFGLNPTLQITSNNIAKIVSKELNIDLDIFKNQNIDKLLNINCDWLRELIYVQSIEDLKRLKTPSSELNMELVKLLDIANTLEYENLIISPLYYTDKRYYDGVIFRFLKNNRVLANGGRYKDDDIYSSGFALKTDNLIEELMKRAKDYE
jgi:ATP phosphoribosyltransferase regulatory subunit HisZ